MIKDEVIALCKPDKNICKMCKLISINCVEGSCIVCFYTGGWGNNHIYNHRYYPMKTGNFIGACITRKVKDENEMLTFIVKSKKEYDREILKYIFKNFDKRKW